MPSLKVVMISSLLLEETLLPSAISYILEEMLVLPSAITSFVAFLLPLAMPPILNGIMFVLPSAIGFKATTLLLLVIVALGIDFD